MTPKKLVNYQKSFIFAKVRKIVATLLISLSFRNYKKCHWCKWYCV